jgi:hypothetical protein
VGEGESEDVPPLSTLMAAADDRGIIDASQRERLHALAGGLRASIAPSRPGSPATEPAEARGDFNAVTVTYTVGRCSSCSR